MIPLLVDLEEEWRGGQNQFLLLLKGLHERGHAAELLGAKGSALGQRASKAGFCVHQTSRQWLRVLAAAHVHKLVRSGRFNLVHVNESHALTAAWLAGVHRHVPLLVARRVGFPLGQGYFSKSRFLAASRIIASSHWVAERAIASGAAMGKVTVIYEGVKVPDGRDNLVRQADRLRWGVGERDQLLGCAGVLLPDKGQEWVIRSLPQLRKEFPQCKLLLAGEGPDRPRLEKLVTDLKLGNSVIFAGFVRDIESFYRALDVFVFPALFEGLGTSLLAAMAHGIPSVTYFGSALGEIVENGNSGLQVEPGNAEALVLALQKILSDPDFAAQLAAAGRRRIAETFSADRMVDETLRLYNQLAV